MRSKWLLTVISVLMLMVASPAVAASDSTFPDVIDLPGGFAPEGIAVGYGSTVYAGSLVDGAIWRGDLRTGAGGVWVDGSEGQIAVGLDFDRSSGNLWVSGGPGGEGRVYDGKTGAEIAVIPLGPGFINDVIVTRTAAYFTNSAAPEFYAVPLDRAGNPSGDAVAVPLTGDFRFQAGQFNSNGIEATADGRRLVIANSFFGELYVVDSHTGVATTIDLGGTIVSGDGILLQGRTLYVVENVRNRVADIAVSADLTTGTVVGYLTSPDFDVPTTVARFGGSLYLVNAKFGTPMIPSTPYEIVGVSR
jgi:hypothetical protein